jgi:hypothetical protein
MLPKTIIRALTMPAFMAGEFVATRWNSAEDKAKFANALMKFIANNFPRQSFTKVLYASATPSGISLIRTRMASTAPSSSATLTRSSFSTRLRWPCYGDPTFTFCDLERAVQRRLRAAKVIDVFRMRDADATRQRELATLERLQAKYGAGRDPAAAPSDSLTSVRAPTESRTQGDLFTA